MDWNGQEKAIFRMMGAKMSMGYFDHLDALVTLRFHHSRLPIRPSPSVVLITCTTGIRNPHRWRTEYVTIAVDVSDFSEETYGTKVADKKQYVDSTSE